MRTRIVIFSQLLALSLIAFSSAEAQYRRPFQVVPRVNRALGVWNGFGYHTCNPGPDSSYYNPWTQKNSFLISKSPQFLSRYGHELNQTPMDLLHSGQPAFGQSAYGTAAGAGYYPSPSVLNADFVPNTRDEGEDEDQDEEETDFESGDYDDDYEEDDLDEGGDFSPREQYEDRFDESADQIGTENDPVDEQAEAFESAEEPGALGDGTEAGGSSTNGAAEGASSSEAAAEDTSMLDPGGIYLPASYPSVSNW